MQLMHEAIIYEFSRGLERAAHIPQNGYRRKLYFEGMVHLGESIALLASAAAQLVRLAGKDLQG
jgi:hypothetical protein